MKHLILTPLVFGLMMGFVIGSWAQECPDLTGVEGLNLICPFDENNTITVDGVFDENGWKTVVWQRDLVRQPMAGTPAPDDDNDVSFRMAAMADAAWLYVGVEVTDDALVADDGGATHIDDSIEIYLDPNHAGTTSYDSDDIQINIGIVNFGRAITDLITGGGGGGNVTEGKCAVIPTDIGYNVEAALPLVRSDAKWNIAPSDGLVIGFNVNLNDDDDGGDRDHKVGWSLNDPDDTAYKDPSHFADLTFVACPCAVSPHGKLASIWGEIKSQ